MLLLQKIPQPNFLAHFLPENLAKSWQHWASTVSWPPGCASYNLPPPLRSTVSTSVPVQRASINFQPHIDAVNYTVSSPGLSVSDILYMCDITVDDLGLEITASLFCRVSSVRVSRQNLNSSNFSHNAILFHHSASKTKMLQFLFLEIPIFTGQCLFSHRSKFFFYD